MYTVTLWNNENFKRMFYSVIVSSTWCTKYKVARSIKPITLLSRVSFKITTVLNQNRIRRKTGVRLCLQSKTRWRQVSWSPILKKLGQGALQKRWLLAKSAKTLPKSRNVLLKQYWKNGCRLRLRVFNQRCQFFNLLGTGVIVMF